MFYEVKLKVTKTIEDGKKKGCQKSITEQYITDVETFANAEYKGLELYNGECDVVQIKRSKVIEIATPLEEGYPVFKAVISKSYELDGKTKEQKYAVLISAKNMDEANKKTAEYMKAGLEDMELKGLQETKILGEI